MKGQNGKKKNDQQVQAEHRLLRKEARSSAERYSARRPHRRGRPNSLRAGAPDALSPDRRLEQPRGAARRTLPALLPELGEGDELIVVDNELRRRHAPSWCASWRRGRGWCRWAGNTRLRRRLQRRRRRGERRPAGDPQPRRGAAARLRRGDPPALAGGTRLGRLAGAGRRRRGATAINSAGNPIHFTGIVWAGGHGEPIAEAPPAGEVTVALRRLPGDPAGDLARGRRLPGRVLPLPRGRRPLAAAAAARRHAVGIEPTAVVAHDYEFGANEQKWRWLERNRLAFLVRDLPGVAAGAAGPGAARDRAGAPRSSRRRGGWGGQKLRANLEFAALAAAAAARAAGGPAAAGRQRRRVRRRAHPRSRLGPHLSPRPLLAGAPRPSRLLAPGRDAPAATTALTSL